MAKFIQTKNGKLLNVDQIALIAIFEEVTPNINAETGEAEAVPTGLYKVKAATVAGWTTLADCKTKEDAEKLLSSYLDGQPITVPYASMVN